MGLGHGGTGLSVQEGKSAFSYHASPTMLKERRGEVISVGLKWKKTWLQILFVAAQEDQHLYSHLYPAGWCLLASLEERHRYRPLIGPGQRDTVLLLVDFGSSSQSKPPIRGISCLSIVLYGIKIGSVIIISIICHSRLWSYLPPITLSLCESRVSIVPIWEMFEFVTLAVNCGKPWWCK